MRIMPSGDLLITTITVEARLALEKESEWLRAIATSAKVKRNTFSVFAHAVRVNGINTAQQVRTITDIHAQNRRLHQDLEILQVRWPKTTIAKGKPYGSLIIEVPTASAANRIIREGLVINREIKRCERFIKEARVT